MTDQATPDYNADMQRQIVATRQAEGRVAELEAQLDRLREERDELKMQLKVNAGGPSAGPWWVERPEGSDAYIAYGTRGDLSETYDLMEAYNVDTDYELLARAPVLRDALQRYANTDNCEYGDGPPCAGDPPFVPLCMYCQACAALSAGGEGMVQ